MLHLHRCVQLYKNRMENDCPENSFEYMEAGDLSEHRLHLCKYYAATTTTKERLTPPLDV